eukprot:9367707-Lingulodinium_polyedra.AAC.1
MPRTPPAPTPLRPPPAVGLVPTAGMRRPAPLAGLVPARSRRPARPCAAGLDPGQGELGRNQRQPAGVPGARARPASE